MQTMMPSDIKVRQGRFCLVRHSAYYGGTTEQVTWRVYEKLAPTASDSNSLYRFDREYNRKWEALEYLSYVSKF
jgi:hypothetical protein